MEIEEERPKVSFADEAPVGGKKRAAEEASQPEKGAKKRKQKKGKK